jgi:hypothetical protein
MIKKANAYSHSLRSQKKREKCFKFRALPEIKPLFFSNARASAKRLIVKITEDLKVSLKLKCEIRSKKENPFEIFSNQ